MRHWRRNVLALAVATGLLAAANASETVEEWSVKGRLFGEPKKNGERKKSVDVSGIACAENDGYPRRCLVIDDELQDAQFVVLEADRLVAGEAVRLIDDAVNGEPLSLDGEGVAYSDGYFYVVGSHGHPRRSKKDIQAKIDASSQIIRFRNDDTGSAIETSQKLKPFFANAAQISEFVDSPLDENGVSIEGIAVADGRLYAGFRGPSSIEGDKAPILSVGVVALFGNDEGDAELFLIELGEGRGVRDLTRYSDGFLILAGPTGESGDYSVFWWDGFGNAVTGLGDLDFKAKKKPKKPEGIVALDERGDALRVLVLFDGEGAKEGDPSVFHVDTPP